MTKQYEVRTKGTTYNRVLRWKHWDADNSFLVFTQFKYPNNENESNEKELILKISDIESITEI